MKFEQYLNMLRLKYASEMAYRDLDVVDMAIVCGFPTLRAFYRSLLDVVDEEGRRLPADERKLTCRLEGEGAELVAIGSGCPCAEDPIGADWCHAWRGTAVIILKAHQPGKIVVSVEAEGLTGCQMEVEAK